MKIEGFELGPIGTNAYLISGDPGGEAVLVDAPEGAAALVENWEEQTGGKVTTLLLTHGHWDHMQDMKRLQDHGLTTMGHRDDALFFTEPEVMRNFAMPGLRLEGGTIDRWLEAGESLEVLGETMEVRHVPGHCPGNLVFHFPGQQVAFVGDAIFRLGVGRYDIPGGSWPVLEQSILNQIYTLPATTMLYPGHGPETQVEYEKTNNPFVQIS